MFQRFFYLVGQTIGAIFLTGVWAIVMTNIFQNSGDFLLVLSGFMPIPMYVFYGVKFKKEAWQKSLVDGTAGLFYVFSMIVTMLTAGIAVPLAIITFICHLSAYGWLVERNHLIGWTNDGRAQSFYNDILNVCSQNNVNIEKGVPAKIIKDYLNTFVKPQHEQHFKEPELKKFFDEKLKNEKLFQINNNEFLKLCNLLSPLFNKVYMKEYK
tara:strand:+ start:102 stop:734 length:633 start_codon:yes stop_codon:yes gene_type:complete